MKMDWGNSFETKRLNWWLKKLSYSRNTILCDVKTPESEVNGYRRRHMSDWPVYTSAESDRGWEREPPIDAPAGVFLRKGSERKRLLRRYVTPVTTSYSMQPSVDLSQRLVSGWNRLHVHLTTASCETRENYVSYSLLSNLLLGPATKCAMIFLSSAEVWIP